MSTLEQTHRTILPAELREAVVHPVGITATVMILSGNWIIRNAAIKRDMS